MAKLGELITTCNGRLTLTTGVPVTTSDVTAATTLYFTPYMGDNIALWNGEEWLFYEFTERSITLASLAADTNFDVFIYDNAGTLTLELVAWTDDTTRATALTTQNGVYVKSGDATRRYLGTIRTTGTIGQCEDSETKRYCWNYYNGLTRFLYYTPGTDSWTYGTITWRVWDNDTSHKVEFVIGVDEKPVDLTASIMQAPGLASGYKGHIGIAIDSTLTPTHQLAGRSMSSVQETKTARLIAFPGIGYHYCHPMESSESGTVTYYCIGSGEYYSSGIIGQING